MARYAAEWGEVYNKSIRALRRPGAQAPAETREKLISLYDDVVKGTPGLVKSLERLDKLDPLLRTEFDYESDANKGKNVKDTRPNFQEGKQVLAGFGKELKTLHSEAAKYKAILDKAIKATDKAKLPEPYREMKLMSTQLDRIIAMLEQRSKKGGEELLKAEEKLAAKLAEQEKKEAQLKKDKDKLSKAAYDKMTGGKTVTIGNRVAPKRPRDEKIEKVLQQVKPQKDKLEAKQSTLKESRNKIEIRKTLGVDFVAKAKSATSEAAATIQTIKSNPTGENYNEHLYKTRDFLDLTAKIMEVLAGRECPKDFAAEIGGLRAQDSLVKRFRTARAVAADATRQQIEAELKDFSKLLKDAAPYFDKVAKYLAKNKI